MKLYSVSFRKIGWIILLYILTGCQNSADNIDESAKVKTDSVTVSTTFFYDKIKGYGTIGALSSLDLEAKFDGIVHFENLKGRIKKGEIIYKLGGPEIKLKEENLKKVLSNAKTQYTYFKQYYEAKKLLLKNNYLSKIDFEKVSRDFENAQVNMNSAQYALDYFLNMTIYKAPFNGYLDNIMVAQGEDAVRGQLLGIFQDDDNLKLETVYYGNTKKLQSKNINIKIDGKSYSGKVIYIERAINSSSGGHTIWVSLKDPEHQLKSGSYVLYSFLLLLNFSTVSIILSGNFPSKYSNINGFPVK